MDLEKSDRLKRAAELDTIFTHVVEHGYKLLGAERCTLFLHDAGKAELWTKMSTGSKRGQAGRQRLAQRVDVVLALACPTWPQDRLLITLPLEKDSIATAACKSHEIVNVAQAL